MMSGKELSLNGIRLTGDEPVTPRTRASIPGRISGFSAPEAADFLDKKRKEDAVIHARLLKSYNLSDLSQVNVEKALRMAAFNNKTADLTVLATLVKNINAQDENPTKKFTALHLAVTKKHIDVIRILKSFNAKSDIADANGITVLQKVRELDMNEISSIFRDDLIVARRTP
jgi:hypothetical protein